MNTSCKNCSFAIYTETEQISCEFHKIDKLPPKVKLIEAFDDDAEFFVLENFTCNTYRDKNKWLHADKPNKKEIALNEIKIDYEVFIKCDPKPILDKISQQTLKPKNVFIMIDNSKQKAGEILKELRAANLPFRWSVTDCINTVDAETQSFATRSKAQFVCIIEKEGDLPDFNKINDSLCLDNNRFALLEGDGCSVIHTMTYRTFGDNIKEFAEETGEESWIQKCEQFI